MVIPMAKGRGLEPRIRRCAERNRKHLAEAAAALLVTNSVRVTVASTTPSSTPVGPMGAKMLVRPWAIIQ